MSIASYNAEQKRMLRHKIGDELYELLDQWLVRGHYGMDKTRPGKTKMELSGLQKNGIRAKVSAENEKPRARHNVTPYSY